MSKVLVYHKVHDEDINYLNAKYTNYDFIVCTNKTEMERHIEDVDVLISFRCTREMLRKAKKLKWFQALSAGVDNFPLNEIERRGIILTNGRGIHRIHMTEYALGVMVMLARNFHIMLRNQYKVKWDKKVYQGGIDGATLGILGLGSIGREIAKKAKFMGMNVLGVKSSISDVEYVDKVYLNDDMLEVFKISDYIINLLPSTQDTFKIIDKSYFNNMKKDACFISIGRGSTVNEEDMIQALQDGRIRAAALDVFFTEPLPEDSPLWKMENVIITPHICGESDRYIERALPIIENNLKAFKGEGEFVNLIDFNKGY